MLQTGDSIYVVQTINSATESGKPYGLHGAYTNSVAALHVACQLPGRWWICEGKINQPGLWQVWCRCEDLQDGVAGCA